MLGRLPPGAATSRLAHIVLCAGEQLAAVNPEPEGLRVAGRGRLGGCVQRAAAAAAQPRPECSTHSTPDHSRPAAHCHRCPGLETLRVLGILASDADLTALQQFAQLTSLSLNNIGDNNAAAQAGNLTGLRELAIAAPNSLTQGVLDPLADLKQLMHFWVQPNQVPEDEEQEEDADYDQRRAAVRWLFRNQVGEACRVGHSCWVVKGCAPSRASSAFTTGAACHTQQCTVCRALVATTMLVADGSSSRRATV